MIARAELSFSGGPPVPLIKDGSWVRRGGAMLLSGSSLSWGVLAPVVGVKFASEFCLGLVSVKGIASDSLPSSSARSVIALFEEPRRSWRPRTRYAVAEKTTMKPMTMDSGQIWGRVLCTQHSSERKDLRFPDKAKSAY